MRRRAQQLTFDELWQDLPGAGNEFAEKAPVPIYRVQIIRESTQLLRHRIHEVEDAADIISEYLAPEDREHFVVLMLDAKNAVLGVHTVSIGTLTSTLVCPREVFKAAILANAASIIVGHNHPSSGDPTPSPQDVAITDALRKIGAILDIPVLDHIIVGHFGKFMSLHRHGYWRELGPEVPN